MQTEGPFFEPFLGAPFHPVGRCQERLKVVTLNHGGMSL